MKRVVWISFDLGVRGDYEGIYTWLDLHEAKECGDSVAFVNYEFEGDLIDSLSVDLKEAVEITRKTRIYVIFFDSEEQKIKGRFIAGGRKAPPWAGHAGVTDNESDSESEEG